MYWSEVKVDELELLEELVLELDEEVEEASVVMWPAPSKSRYPMVTEGEAAVVVVVPVAPVVVVTVWV